MIFLNPPTPSTFEDFVGQRRVKDRMRVAIEAARMRREALAHALFAGPTGLGKATFAHVLARVMSVNIVVTSGPALGRAGDLAGLLTSLEVGDILFVEEIYRVPRPVAEHLRVAMEDCRLDVVIDQGPNARGVKLTLPRFTVIGSAQDTKQVTESLRLCFPIVERFDYYDAEELTIILKRAAQTCNIEVDDLALNQIAEHAAGTPRVACNLLQHVRDFAQAKRSSGRITAETVRAAFELLEFEKQTSSAGYERIPIPRDVRIQVWRRDGGKCVRCGSREKLEFDHIIPVVKGGGNTARNIELLCESCNRSKSANIQ